MIPFAEPKIKVKAKLGAYERMHKDVAFISTALAFKPVED